MLKIVCIVAFCRFSCSRVKHSCSTRIWSSSLLFQSVVSFVPLTWVCADLAGSLVHVCADLAGPELSVSVVQGSGPPPCYYSL